MLTLNAKKRGGLCFWLITVIYIAVRWITFNGFNGTDDLHYAMLSANLLKGSYNPFQPADIFSGRVLLVLVQAFFYLTGGINAFTTQAGTFVTVITSCYLLIFKLARYTNWQPVVLASSLFYFNPVMKTITTGIMPDAYILLAGVVILLLLEQIREHKSGKYPLTQGIIIGGVAFLAMFFKENALVFIPFFFLLSLTQNAGTRKYFMQSAFSAAGVFCLGVLISGLVYYQYTGDFFFRVTQIKNSEYTNACNYNTSSFSFLFERLTYGVWYRFIIDGFYPVVAAALLIVLDCLFLKSVKPLQNTLVRSFLCLACVAVYFPFSFKGYEPLCAGARHFIFLLPQAILVFVSYFEKAGTEKRLKSVYVVVSAIILAACMTRSYLKWYQLVYGLILCFVLLQALVHHAILQKYRSIFFALMLFVFVGYEVLNHRPRWFSDMQMAAKKTNSTIFYFPDHDNMSHFELLHGFDRTMHFYTLEKSPFKIFQPYVERPDSNRFVSGWFIVNRSYSPLPHKFFSFIDKLKSTGYFSRQTSYGVIDAFYIDRPEQLRDMRDLISNSLAISPNLK